MPSRFSTGPYQNIRDAETGHFRKRSGGNVLSQSTFANSMTEKYSLSADPASWGSALSPEDAEPDDHLHNPTKRDDDTGTFFTGRGFANLGCLLLILVCIVALFAGYPLATYFTQSTLSSFGGFNIGGLNASGQVPTMMGNRGLIDVDTPKEAYTKNGYYNKKKMQLVFSDEFNVDGRTFYPGDDPYWEAVDLHYWGTNNLEWYDPQAITTKKGALEISLTKKETHDLHYQGGMMATWNKFCFTGGLIEAAVTLPGASNVMGLWPAIWMMGNLGRAGYGASLEGTWPYTYDSCDVGTAPNQTKNGLPAAALTQGDHKYQNHLSYLQGQRLSRCTCPGEEHPGPMHADGTYVGRAAPEIDFFEAQVSTDEETGEKVGHVSQSGQFAPFNVNYEWNNATNMIIPDPTISEINGFKGNVFQQAMSVVSKTNQNCYQLGGTSCFAIYGVEYKRGFDDAYISWLNDGKIAWTMLAAGAGADPVAEISARPMPMEPMYLIMNLGMSENFGTVEYDKLVFPAIMRVDYIRVYQPTDEINVGCDPSDFPTRAYIERFPEAYSNANLTTWKDDYKQRVPKNKFLETCDSL
ncbi:beta-glucan synthesis-associated protein [Flagelloscypha sp. PMI_526]|nr:beta-glucan synthesis-associated protein [Flagelloscypha sp. PMI_526]